MSNSGNSLQNNMPKLNIITGITLIIFCLFAIFWLIPYRIADANVQHYVNSPKFYPYLCVLLLGFLSICLIISNLVRIKRQASSNAEESEDNELLGFGKDEMINLLVFSAATAGYLFLFKTTGFVISSSILLFLAMFFAKMRNPLVLLIVGMGWPFLIKQILWYSLQVSLP